MFLTELAHFNVNQRTSSIQLARKHFRTRQYLTNILLNLKYFNVFCCILRLGWAQWLRTQLTLGVELGRGWEGARKSLGRGAEGAGKGLARGLAAAGKGLGRGWEWD